MSTVRTRIGGLLAIGCVVALMVVGPTPAFAHHKDDHGKESTSDESPAEEQSTEASGEDSGYDGRRTTSATREPEPDPEPSQAPPSTKGPGDCGDYSQIDSGPYDHDNCDGSQGMQGSDGNEKCAGCTGKSDDKSPGGQARNDHNNGYECDNNGGVGKGNPPHARCPKPPTGSSAPVCPSNPSLPLNHPDCGVVGGPPSGPRVLPNVIRNLAQPRAERVRAGAVLPFTGAGSVLTLLITGLTLIGSGTLAMRTRRKK